MCARVRFFALIIRRSQNTRFLCRTRLRFFALMIHKSVTCAMVPNNQACDWPKKINYTCTFFWRRELPNFCFLAHEYFTCFICVVCFPRCRCQNRQISGRGSRNVRLRIEGNRRQGHDVYPGSGPLDGGNTLLPAWLSWMNMGFTRVDLPRDRNG